MITLVPTIGVIEITEALDHSIQKNLNVFFTTMVPNKDNT